MKKKILFQKEKVKWLSITDRNKAYFNKTIKSRKQRNRIDVVCDENGRIFEGNDVAEQFIKHFQQFLGESRHVEPISDMDSLFWCKLSSVEAEYMVREVSNEEIKVSMFQIDDNKAPGPDAHYAAFFKKAWNVVGNDVCLAVKEFFKTRKIPREINSTLIALVLKILLPLKVSDFRPIACCNVIYKCISKVLTERLKGCLDKLLKVTNVRFADDLLMFCHDDKSFVKVLKESIDEFGKVVGLIPNYNKNTIIFGSLDDDEKKDLLEVMPFKVENLLIRYLGVPLTSKRLRAKECRLMLVASVLETIHVYWAFVFLLPVGIIEDINKLLKNFLWQQTDGTKGRAKLA
ncbi:hypothetical protein Tco_1501281 [Tanacetum coccineum]